MPLLSLHLLHSNAQEPLRSSPWPRYAEHNWGSSHVLGTWELGAQTWMFPPLSQMYKENVFYTCEVGRSRG